jgi:polyisoprenoid-binding protein YceI
MNVVSGRSFFAGLFVFGLAVAVYATDMLNLVKEQSQIEFVGSKPGASHRGGFKRFTADAAVDWGDLSRSSFKIEVDTTSVWTDSGGLAAHLRNADFFDVSRYPTITFETTRIELKSTSEAVVTGTLTMLGKAVEVAIPCKIEVADGGLRVKSEFKIDRMQWGMTYGKGRVEDEVEITTRFAFGR